MGEWHYVGHYGQLGPLTREQMDELVRDGVVLPETLVWRAGFPDWTPASRTAEFGGQFAPPSPSVAPPPTPTATSSPGVAAPPFASGPAAPIASSSGYPYGGYAPPGASGYSLGQSDRSRTLGGVLQLIIPGVGRIYLGYAAIGIIQLVLAMCFVGWLWSLIDGIMILCGTVKLDGYGRTLAE